MRVVFEKLTNPLKNEPQIVVKATERNSDVERMIQKIETLMIESPKIIPVKTTDRIIMVKLEDLVLVEVMGEKLTFFVKDIQIESNGHLNKLLEQINNQEFVQVSRHAIINLNHLEALEASFGGTLVAKLSGGRKTTVSRKYVREIESRLGI
jgi:two-component system response regulator LytT